MQPYHDDYESAGELRQALLKLEYEDIIIAQRERREALDLDRLSLHPAVDSARRILLERIKARRLVIETSPSSNLRILGRRSLGDSPSVNLIKQIPLGLLVCINTDDPGIFGTRIENEYALLLQGLIDSGKTQSEARSILECAREVGMEFVR